MQNWKGITLERAPGEPKRKKKQNINFNESKTQEFSLTFREQYFFYNI